MAVNGLSLTVGNEQRPIIGLYTKQNNIETAYSIPVGSTVKCVVLKKASRAKQTGVIDVIYPSGNIPIAISTGDLGNDWANGMVSPLITAAYSNLLLAANTEALEMEILVIPPSPATPLYFYEDVIISRTAIQV